MTLAFDAAELRARMRNLDERGWALDWGTERHKNRPAIRESTALARQAGALEARADRMAEPRRQLRERSIASWGGAAVRPLAFRVNSFTDDADARRLCADAQAAISAFRTARQRRGYPAI